MSKVSLSAPIGVYLFMSAHRWASDLASEYEDGLQFSLKQMRGGEPLRPA